MHDICEGVGHYFLNNFFGFLYDKKIITPKKLADSIAHHDYGILNRRNIPSGVFEKNKMRINASQTKCLLHDLPFILHAFENESCLREIWHCLQSLLTIIKISYSNTIKEIHLQELECAVERHLQGMIKCFGITLKPKHHFMTHYAHIIRCVGPLIHMSSLRFEMKHK